MAYPHGILMEPDATAIYSLAWGTKGLTVAPLSAPLDGGSDFILPEFIQYTQYQGLSSSKDTVILEPFTFSYRRAPETTWSKSTTSDTLFTEWHWFLEKFGMENWQSDYGKGLVFTWENSTQSAPNDLTMTFYVENSTNYHLLTRFFQNCKGGSVNLYLDNQELTLNTSDKLNKFVWVDLGEFFIYKLGEHTLTIRNIEGFNAFNLFVIVPRQELQKIKGAVGDSLSNRTMINILEAESDMYSEGALLEKEGNASNGELLSLLDGKVWQNFDILRDGPYTIALNLNGTFNVKVDNSTYSVSSDSLDLKYIGPINLTKGSHFIQITPVITPANWGFSEQDFEEWKLYTPENQFGSLYIIYWDQTENAFRAELFNSTWGWKTIVSPLVPIKQNTTYWLNFSVKANNGFGVHFKIFEYNSLRQYVNSTYVFIGDGSFDWQDISYDYRPSDPSTAYIQLQIWHGHETNQSFPNTVSIRNVKIRENVSNQLDVIWVYPQNNPLSNATLEALFSADEAPAIVKNYTRVNPTLWKLELDSNRPFILSFAESYEPQWEARVYKDGILLEKAYSFPLYNTINGFWINSTGSNLEVVIVYTTQDSFNFGLAISGLTLLSLLVYLGLDFSRRKIKWGSSFPKKL